MDGQRGMAAWRGEYEAAGPGPGQMPEWAGLSNDQEALLAALQARSEPLLIAPQGAKRPLELPTYSCEVEAPVSHCCVGLYS